LVERSNDKWVAVLSQPSPERDQALDELRARLMRGLGYALTQRRGVDESLIEDLVQDALMRILDAVDRFRGESQFTTWATKIAVNLAYTELRRRRWTNVSLDEIIDNPERVFILSIMTDRAPGPEQRTVQKAVLATIQEAIDEDLTERQRQALVAVKVKGMPLEEVARRMDTNRNALYKLLHDARQRLREALLDKGLSPEEILAAFE
jgi:RNA polymerase sigma-70 factor (ECF subfamily)